MHVQALLFDRAAGWTAASAKAWAKSHGYKHGKVHITDQYVRIRQFDPKGLKVKRTVTFGQGIRAVVAREKDKEEGDIMMAKRRRTKKAAHRRTHRAREVSEKKRPRRRHRAKSPSVVAAPKRRRARRRKVAAKVVAAPKRRRHRRARKVHAWHGQKKKHATAAKKGWARRKRKGTAHVKRRRVHEVAAFVAAPRHRRRAARVTPRRRRARETMVAAPRRRHHRRMRAVGGGGGMSFMELGMAVVSSGVGFLAADALDRFLATYNPAAAPPADKFTSPGVGTLANTLNIASPPNMIRLAASVGSVVVPAVGSRFVRNKMIKGSLEGIAVGGGIKLLSLLVNNVLMPLLTPKDSTPTGLQKSMIVRLYPSELAASLNLKAHATSVSSSGSGALSGTGDVGPFALASVGGDSPYPNVEQALRAQAGVQGPGSNYPTLQNTWGTGNNIPGWPGVGEYPTVAQQLRQQAGMSAPPAAGDVYAPAAPPGPGPGPSSAGPQARPHTDPACGCVGENNPYLGWLENPDTAA